MKRKRDLDLARDGIERFLRGLGYDPQSDPLVANTAARVVEAWSQELLSGRDVDVQRMLQDESEPVDTAKQPPLVVLRDLETVTMCPHHLLPALGTATVVYLPHQRVAGLGTIARVVDAFSRRLVLQETIGQLIVDALVEHLGARGAACRLSFSHTCLMVRGERQRSSSIQTVAFAGTFTDAGPSRDLVMAELFAR